MKLEKNELLIGTSNNGSFRNLCGMTTTILNEVKSLVQEKNMNGSWVIITQGEEVIASPEQKAGGRDESSRDVHIGCLSEEAIQFLEGRENELAKTGVAANASCGCGWPTSIIPKVGLKKEVMAWRRAMVEALSE